MLNYTGNETIKIFGHEMLLREVIYLVRFAITKRWRQKAELCLAMRNVDFDEIESETFEIILQQQRHAKWNSHPCKPSTAIAQCAWYAMGNILRRRKHKPIIGCEIREHHIQDERESPTKWMFRETYVDRALRLLSGTHRLLIKLRYGGRRTAQLRYVASRLKVSGRNVCRIEQEAIGILRSLGRSIFE